MKILFFICSFVFASIRWVEKNTNDEGARPAIRTRRFFKPLQIKVYDFKTFADVIWSVAEERKDIMNEIQALSVALGKDDSYVKESWYKVIEVFFTRNSDLRNACNNHAIVKSNAINAALYIKHTLLDKKNDLDIEKLKCQLLEFLKIKKGKSLLELSRFDFTFVNIDRCLTGLVANKQFQSIN